MKVALLPTVGTPFYQRRDVFYFQVLSDSTLSEHQDPEKARLTSIPLQLWSEKAVHVEETALTAAAEEILELLDLAASLSVSRPAGGHLEIERAVK